MARDGEVGSDNGSLEFVLSTHENEAADAVAAHSGLGRFVVWTTPDGVDLEFLDSLTSRATRIRLDVGAGGEHGGVPTPSEIAAALCALGLGHGPRDSAVDGPKEPTDDMTVESATSGFIVGNPEIRIGGTDDAPVVIHLGDLDNHSAATSVGGTTASRKFSAIWVASEPGDSSGFGRILLQRVDLSAGAAEPVHIWRAGSDGVTAGAGTGAVRLAPSAANDNVVWVGSESGVGAYGREPHVAVLQDGDTLVTWIGTDGHVHGRYYSDDTPAEGVALADHHIDALNELLADLGPAAGHALFEERQRVRVASLGDQTLALLWVAGIAGALELRGKIFALDGGGDHAWAAADIEPIPLPERFAGQFDVAALEGGGGDGVITFVEATASGPQTFALLLDATSFALDADEAGAGGLAISGAIGTSSPPIAVRSGIYDSAPAAAVDADAAAADAPAAAVAIGDTVIEYDNVLLGDLYVEVDGVAGFSDGDIVKSSDDVIVGTDQNDIIIGDLAGADGGSDKLSGGDGEDLLFGGAKDDHIDGGAGDHDIAVYQGNAKKHAISVNGDGSHTIVDASSDDGEAANGDKADGADRATGIEHYLFLDGDKKFVTDVAFGGNKGHAHVGHQHVDSSDLYKLKGDNERVTGNSDQDADGVETVVAPVGWGLDQHTAEHGQTVAATEGAGSTETKPVVIGQGNGFAVAWQSDNGDGTQSLNVVQYDVLGQPENGGAVRTITAQAAADSPAAIGGGSSGIVAAWVAPASGDGAVSIVTAYVSSDGEAASASISLDSCAAVAEMAVSGGAGTNVAVAWVEASDDADHGAVLVQGLVVREHDDEHEGTHDSEAHETQPIIVSEDGHGVAVSSLAGGEIAVALIETSSNSIVGGLFGAAGNSILDFDLGALGFLAGGTVNGAPKLLSTDNGDLLVSWQLDLTDGGADIAGARFHREGDGHWGQPERSFLQHFDDDAPESFNITLVAGANGEQQLVVTWVDGDNSGSGSRNKVEGQTFSLDGEPIGDKFKVSAAGDLAKVTASDTGGFNDGQFVVAMVAPAGDGADTTITLQILDTRTAEAPLVGDNSGSGKDLGVGTVFDDIIDGASNTDDLHGALGDDIVLGGTGDDRLFGDDGDDELSGGTGSDTLEGGAGDDLLMGGHGRDYLSGGAGEDTASYRGEVRDVAIDLAKGEIRSNGADSAARISAIYAGVVPGLSADGDGIVIEDVIGQIIRLDDGGYKFIKTFDIENAEGGLGNDLLRGTKGANKLWGGAGDDRLEGGDGDDLLDGGSGYDQLFGGFGNDTFVFRAGYGNDYIGDFGDREGDDDWIAVDGNVFATFEAIFDALAQVGDDVVLSLSSSDTLTLKKTDLNDLDANDFRIL